MAPRSILKSLPFISHFPYPDPPSNSQPDCRTFNSVLTPSLSNNPLPFASSSHIPPLDSPHVHFPPTPIMTRMGMTHSPFSYDRKSITVSPNVCAMPERGERDVFDNEMDENDSPEDQEENYFHSRSIFSQDTQRRGETRSPRLLASRSGTRSMSPSRPPRTIRTRCHSLPSPPPLQSFPPRIYPNYRRRHTDPYPNPSRQQVALTIPPLVFDHSSEESDLEDVCESPQPQGADSDYIMFMEPPGISRNLGHFPRGFSLEQGDTPFSNPADGGKLPTITNPKIDDSKKSMTETRPYGVAVEEGNSAARLEGKPEEDAVADLMMDSSNSSNGLGLVTQTKTQSRDSNAGGFSNFYEPVLEGCLGGF